jgi:hypothetical protein
MALTAFVVVVQAVVFFPLDSVLPPLSKAVHQYESDDIIEISLRDDPNPMSRYSVWIALAEIAPYSTMYSPISGEHSEPHRAYGFGLVDQVVVVPKTDSSMPEDFDFLPFVVAQGPGAHKGAPWFIALDPANGEGGDPSDPEGFLPRAIADGNRGSDPGPPREFASLRWRGAPVNAESEGFYDYHTVIIETSLLSEELRGRLGIPAMDGGAS